MKKVKQIVKQNRNSQKLAGAHGSRTHQRHSVPPDGFEVREAHRDSSAPLVYLPHRASSAVLTLYWRSVCYNFSL
jgi:hypothetical protein